MRAAASLTPARRGVEGASDAVGDSGPTEWEYDRGVPAPRRSGGTHSRLGNAARTTLAGIRMFNGAMGLVAPAMTARRIGTPEGAPLYPWRMFGVRTVIIGAELLSRDPRKRDLAVRLALPIHATDTLSAAVGGLLGETSKRTTIMLTAISGTNTVLALLARRTMS